MLFVNNYSVPKNGAKIYFTILGKYSKAVDTIVSILQKIFETYGESLFVLMYNVV